MITWSWWLAMIFPCQNTCSCGFFNRHLFPVLSFFGFLRLGPKAVIKGLIWCDRHAKGNVVHVNLPKIPTRRDFIACCWFLQNKCVTWCPMVLWSYGPMVLWQPRLRNSIRSSLGSFDLPMDDCQGLGFHPVLTWPWQICCMVYIYIYVCVCACLCVYVYVYIYI